MKKRGERKEPLYMKLEINDVRRRGSGFGTSGLIDIEEGVAGDVGE